MNIKVGKQAIAEATQKLTNWGRWGKEDQIGTLNHVTPEDIVKAASLIRSGKVFALGIPLDRTGPQTGLFGGRFNPIHQMLATGTDAISGQQDWNKIRYADDTLTLCVQGATHWDALGHIFYEDKAYNGYDAKLIELARPLGSSASSIPRSKMVGRGVLLDIARFRGVNVAAGRREHLQRRTGQVRQRAERLHPAAAISSSYAPGKWSVASQDKLGWLRRRRRAGRQVRELLLVSGKANSRRSAPTPGASRCGRTKRPKRNQPWHWVVIPAMGLCMGEIFYLKELAEDCDADGVYEFFFCGPPLIITGGTGSPINPQAIK